MATAVVILKGHPVPHEEKIYRALNPKHLEDGLPGENHFIMKQNHPPGDGVSTGLASLISLRELRSIEALTQLLGASFGVAELLISEAIAPVATLGITVLQQDDPSWGAHAGAHAIITGYQALKGREGKRKIQDFQRHLVRLARRRYYPSGSDFAVSAE
jgi:hypothetical protein